jgi:hypothetical protein
MATSTLDVDDAAKSSADQSSSISASADATGGWGGTSETGAGTGGTATATMSGAAGASTSISFTASAQGGNGGSVTSSGDGIAGNKGTASASDTSAEQATVHAYGYGGNGGTGVGAGNVGGKGGAATATASGYASGSVNVLADVVAGSGGNGTSGADGGPGGAASMDNAATASTASTAGITVQQNASGGSGGNSSSGLGGAGGSATAEQQVNATHSTSSMDVTVNDSAYGGQGGGGGSLSQGGAGGAATANVVAYGRGTVNVNVTADGGWSHTKGGAATATLDAIGGSSNDAATANAGGSDTAGAKATAIETADGSNGSLDATATSAPQGQTVRPNTLLNSISANNTTSLYGAGASNEALATFGGSVTALTGLNGVAEGIAAPTGYAGILNANSMIKNALGPHPAIFMMGEVGGAYAGNGTGTQTTTSTIQANVDLGQLSASGDFVLGLFDGSITDAAGVSSVSVTVTGGFFGPTYFSQTYSGSNVQAAFSDKAPPMMNQAFTNSGDHDLEVTVTVTTTAPGAGFTGDFLIGDPPQTQTIDVNGITGHAYTSEAKTYTDGVLTSVAQYTSPGHLLQDIAISHNVSAFGLSGLTEGIQTNIAGTTDSERDVYRDSSGHIQLVVSHLADGALDIAAHTGDLTFDFGSSSAVESIGGYLPGADTFDVSHTLFSSFSEMMSHAEQQGHNVVINYDASDVLTLTGVTLSELNAHASDFHFV